MDIYNNEWDVRSIFIFNQVHAAVDVLFLVVRFVGRNGGEGLPLSKRKVVVAATMIKQIINLSRLHHGSCSTTRQYHI
jgi:3-phenylpropionate/cinnamic acid dioxygenase small subunit